MTGAPDDRDTAGKIVSASRRLGLNRLVYDHDALVIRIAAALRAAREDGRRQGASEMRENIREIVQRSIKAATAHMGDYAAATKATASFIDEAIRALPLPGDAPAK